MMRGAAAACRRATRAAAAYRARRRDLRRGRRDQRGDRPPRPRADPRASPRASAGRAGQHPHPLQRRLARHRRLGHRDSRRSTWRTRRASRPCLGRRDPAAQPGRLAHRLGARPARRAAHRHRRQRRRPPDAARPGRPRASSAPTAPPRNGDVCNKIGTYLKALAAHDNGVPFYVALPSPTIDWTVRDGVREIPIEERGGDEVTHMTGPHRRRPDRNRADHARRLARRQLRL